jgi:hypothetical protein
MPEAKRETRSRDKRKQTETSRQRKKKEIETVRQRKPAPSKIQNKPLPKSKTSRAQRKQRSTTNSARSSQAPVNEKRKEKRPRKPRSRPSTTSKVPIERKLLQELSTTIKEEVKDVKEGKVPPEEAQDSKSWLETATEIVTEWGPALLKLGEAVLSLV